MRIYMPQTEEPIVKFIEDIPKFLDNFRLTDWLPMGGKKGFEKNQQVFVHKVLHKQSGNRYSKRAKVRLSQGFITNASWLAGEMLRINKTKRISPVSISTLFDSNSYNSERDTNPMFASIWMDWIDIDAELIPEEWVYLKKKFK